MLINHAARQRYNLVSECFTPTEVYCDFDGTITSLDATDAVLPAQVLNTDSGPGVLQHGDELLLDMAFSGHTPPPFDP
jgi:hypothetical protein